MRIQTLICSSVLLTEAALLNGCLISCFYSAIIFLIFTPHEVFIKIYIE